MVLKKRGIVRASIGRCPFFGAQLGLVGIIQYFFLNFNSMPLFTSITERYRNTVRLTHLVEYAQTEEWS